MNHSLMKVTFFITVPAHTEFDLTIVSLLEATKTAQI